MYVMKREAVCKVMIEQVFPRAQALIMESAKQFIIENGGSPLEFDDPYVMDEAAQEIIKQLAEFLIMDEAFAFHESKLIHPRQMTSEHAKVWWHHE